MYVQTTLLTTKQTITIQCNYIVKGKHQVLSREVTCNVRLYLETGRTSVNPNLKHRKLDVATSVVCTH